jgi:hypothetical protein
MSKALKTHKIKYFSRFALKHKNEMRRLVEGRVLGIGIEDSRGWRNVAEHNLLAGVIADRICELSGLPASDRMEVTSAANTHDWDKRIEKECLKIGSAKQGRLTVLQVDVIGTVRKERAKCGLIRVTGQDWRDFRTWGLKEKILRYVDSSLDQTLDGHADFVDWNMRIANLGKRHPDINKESGSIYGEGALLFDRLAEITEEIERDLYEIIIDKNPQLTQQYPRAETLGRLIRDHVTTEIEVYSS